MFSKSLPASAGLSRLLRKPVALAVIGLSLGAALAPAYAAQATPVVTTQIGKADISVRQFGALGNGVHDDTAAIQAAINSLPKAGGTVHIPAGRYMINGLKPLQMRSHTRLWLAGNAELDVIPNSATRYYAIKVFGVNDVRIIGGTLRGDRARHQGTTGEWGFGIDINGSDNVVVKGVKLADFWGDGIWIGGLGSVKKGNLDRSNNVWIDHVTSDNNRRQGLSMGPANNVWITNSVFSNTYGTLPMAGIDIEPMGQGPVGNVHISHNIFKGNHGNGIEIHAGIDGLSVSQNKMLENNGFGVLSVAGGNMAFSNNTLSRNGLAGLGLNGGTNHVVAKYNEITFNSTRYMPVTKKGGALNRDLQVKAKNNIDIQSNNVFTPKR